MDQTGTSEEAYESAAERYDAINSAIAARRAALEQQMNALENEWNDALAALSKHEAYPGIPAWSHPADPAACNIRGHCRIHKTGVPA